MAWDYRTIRAFLEDAETAAARAAVPFLTDYRRLVEKTILGGALMGPFKGLSEKASFVLARHDDFVVLRDALQVFESELRALVESLVGEIKNADWWDEDWEAGTEDSSTSIYARKRTWGQSPAESFWIGLTDINLDAFSTEPKATSYLKVPKAMKRVDAVTARLRALATEIDPAAEANPTYPFWRYVALGNLRAEPDKIRDRLLAEFDVLARFAPTIDEITESSVTKS